jgi:hypothetical protein
MTSYDVVTRCKLLEDAVVISTRGQFICLLSSIFVAHFIAFSFKMTDTI